MYANTIGCLSSWMLGEVGKGDVMQVSDNITEIHERRNYKPERSALWDRLSMSQKFSASSLIQFGYELTCIRRTEEENLALLVCGENVATVNVEGEINTTSKVMVRVSNT